MSKPSAAAVALAEEALKALAKEDMLYAHHGTVHSRGLETYQRLAEFFEKYAATKQKLETSATYGKVVGVKGITDWCSEAHANATSKGFTDASVGEDIALMHSELSEALEEHRAGKLPNALYYTSTDGQAFDEMWPRDSDGEPNFDRLPLKPCGVPSELADVIIRIFHFSGKHEVPLERAIREKMLYNATRPFKHGGKKL